jgi:protein-tyrosine phosphatase
MIDIHTHILPAVDDGADDLQTAVAMVRLAAADGITHIVATPHHEAFEKWPRAEIVRRVAELQQELDRLDIDVTVIPGCEIFLYQDTLRDLEHELAGPLGESRYLLMESGFHQFGPPELAILKEVIAWGYTPVLAHPERIIPIQQDLSLIEDIILGGALVQITAAIAEGACRSGRFSRLFPGHNARATALELLHRGWVHVLASDAHNTTTRRPCLAGARAAVGELFGAERATAMVTSTPARILGIELAEAPVSLEQT